MSLVVKRWFASMQPNSDGIYIRIEGRESGVLAWFLSLLEIDPTTELELNRHGLVFTQGSLAGSIKKFIPRQSLCSLHYGYRKPWKSSLLIGVVTVSFCGAGLVLGPLWYFLNKKLSLGFTEHSGETSEIEFVRSVIEGEAVDEARAKQVIDILRSICLENS